MTRNAIAHHPSTLATRLGWGLLSTLLVVAAPARAQDLGNVWDEEGPSPITGGQTEGLAGNPVSGAINSVAAHPTNADVLYVGAVNGGVWRTTDATAASPTWTRLTVFEDSQSIGSIDFDPTDGTHNTLAASIGLFSSYASVGGSRSGILRTTDGVNFTQITGNSNELLGLNLVGVAPRGSTLVTATNFSSPFTCSLLGVWRSTDTGGTWTRTLVGVIDALAGDPTSATTLYASVVFGPTCGGPANGIYRSTDTGATWAKVSSAAMDALLPNSSGANVDIVVGGSGQVFISFLPSGAYGGLFRSPTGLAGTWTAMDVPSHAAGSLNPGGQGSIHSSIAADPTDTDVVYLGGDRQGSPFPNAIGAVNFSGNLARCDAGLAPGSQCTHITHSNTASNSSPHADSRDMVFDANGNLIETDDGGIYKRTLPLSAAGDWLSLNSNLQVTEDHGVAYDSLNDRLLTGNQDTGSGQQTSASGPVWSQISQGDGGDVLSGPGAAPSTEDRYSSFQNLSNFRRQTFNSSDSLVTSTTLPLAGASISPQFSTPLAINEVAPARILIGGGNGVFESLDRGATASAVPGGAIVANSFDGAGAIAAGGAGNAEMLVVAADSGPSGSGLYVRTTLGGSLSNVQSAAGGQFMVGATIDPDDATHIFGADTANVYRSTNSGSTVTNITNNLFTAPNNPGVLRSIEYVNGGGAAGDALVVGADRGAYVAYAGSGFSTWSRFGGGLPNSPVFELTYDAAADALFAGLFGGGVYRMTTASDAATCGYNLQLVTGNWKQISMVCDPGGANTLADVFGDDLDGTYDVNWVVYRRDATTQAYVKLGLTDTLSVGTAYWIKTNLGNQFVDNRVAVNPVTDVPLATSTTDGAGCGSSAGRCNMVGNPHAFDVCWADVVVDDGGVIKNLATVDPGGACQGVNAAANGCIMSRVAHKWTGASYAPFDGQTPGMEGTLVPWDGFWVSGVKSGIEIRVPATAGSCGPPAITVGAPAIGAPSAARGGVGGLSASAPSPWFIRLIAEANGLEDRSNVFGQSAASTDGPDAFDLIELDPFGADYLTVVFPHPDWRAAAGNYSSDYHGYKNRRKPKREQWNFEVRSSDPDARVVLRWEGPATQISGSRLFDNTTGRRIRPRPDGSYAFQMTGPSHSFTWRVKGTALPQ